MPICNAFTPRNCRLQQYLSVPTGLIASHGYSCTCSDRMIQLDKWCTRKREKETTRQHRRVCRCAGANTHFSKLGLKPMTRVRATTAANSKRVFPHAKKKSVPQHDHWEWLSSTLPLVPLYSSSGCHAMPTQKFLKQPPKRAARPPPLHDAQT